MKRIRVILSLSLVISLSLAVVGCVSAPKGFLKPGENSLEKRQLQMRQYDTADETKIITSVAGVLQDLSFTLDDSETKLGLVSASKKADAKDGGQIAGAILLDVLLGSNTLSQCDKNQMVKVSVITSPGLDGKSTVVRVTFQRIVWNMTNQISRLETINDPEIYQKFYDGLSRAIFLEAHKI
ncbi:MAG: hypothetical protein HY761_06100 [Candidatus Omnitrophica bacterium]|nr:hypothetical protein [Candidatus Omnitrophota bacterium]